MAHHKLWYYGPAIKWQKVSVLDEKTVCHILVRYIRAQFRDVSSTVFHTVGNKLREKYPLSFGHTLRTGNNIITTKYDPFVNGMINRNNYLKHYKDKNTVSNYKVVDRNKKGISKTAQIFKNAARNWQPINYPDNENEQSLIQKIQWILTMSSKVLKTAEENEIILKYMDTTYCLQRTFLNNVIAPPTIEQIKEEWPFLLEKPCLIRHFSFLCQIPANYYNANYLINK